MSVFLEDVVEALKNERLLPDASATEAGAVMERLRSVQPWYVRAMVGLGAWLASLLVISFVAGFSIAVGGVTLVGLGLVIGAVTVRRQSGNDFLVQCTLTASLAGQALFAFGVADLGPGSNEELLCVVAIIMSAVLFFVFPDRIHRVLSVLFATSALTILIYLLEGNALVPVLGPAFAGTLVLVQRQRTRMTAAGHGDLVRPLENGLLLSAFGCLMLSTVYVLPELDLEFRFYPRAWMSTVLLGALLLYVVRRSWSGLLEGRSFAPIVYGLAILVIAASWAAPGLLLALIVTLLGTAAGNRSFTGAGIAFLAVFVATYFYGIEMTMLTKSITLAASGAAVLFARWLLLRVLASTPEKGEVQHG